MPNSNSCSVPVTDSKKKSIVESITDIAIGFAMYLPINFFVLPMFAGEIANQEIVGFLQISFRAIITESAGVPSTEKHSTPFIRFFCFHVILFFCLHKSGLIIELKFNFGQNEKVISRKPNFILEKKMNFCVLVNPVQITSFTYMQTFFSI